MAYDESWDRPHAPGAPANWQESDCYWFHDAAAGIGGYHRIGQYPNQKNGQALLYAFKSGGQQFRRITSYSADQCERSEHGQRVGGSTVQARGDGVMAYGWAEEGCEADLCFRDPFYAPRSWMKDEGAHAGAAAVKQDMNTDGHLEVSGRITGRLRIGDAWHEIDALAHRDRSWGARDYTKAYQHRMVTGTIGPDLSWATFIMRLDNGALAKAGFVARNGETTDIADIRVLTEFDHDGVTVSRLRSRLTLETGESIDIDGPALQGAMFETETWLASSHHFIDLAGAHGRGFTILDATNRPSKGTYIPKPGDLSLVCAEDGLSAAADYAILH